MSKKVAEILSFAAADQPSEWISNLWVTYNNQRRGKIEEWKELRNYVFATDTRTTSNSSLPWKNSTTLPKLCQIRDNLHSNYLSAIFPNDDWLRWEGFSREASVVAKSQAIEAYMKNKVREGKTRTEVSKILYDYIDYGNAFATVSFEANYVEGPDGQKVPDYIGPRLKRISPLDIVFNPLADTFKDTFKIVRSIKTVGELKQQAVNEPENAFLTAALARREIISEKMGQYSTEDFDKAVGYLVDGFGNMQEYYRSGYVEVLEFFGDYHDATTGTVYPNRHITIIDRASVVDDKQIPSWLGHAPIYHVGWRFRQDNLWAMGPLDNLVGMQYRIDHLENLKADAMDLVVHPPLKIIGEVEEFVWGPGVEIHIDENGDVQELGQNLNAIITAANEIQTLEDRMELYAGAPREAAGVRTPGEKTKFEVQSLITAAGRIFQEKVTTFEVELLEPTLNAMLEVSRRNMDTFDVVRVMDDDLGVASFLQITREDLSASGKLRPIGARHFSKQAIDLQNMMGLFNSPMSQIVAPHISSKNLTKFLDDVLGVSAYEIFKPNAAVFEQQETQGLINQATEDLTMQQEVQGEPPL